MPMPPIRFGAFLMLHPPEEQFAIARRVDELGYDSLWTGDHVSFHGPIYESLTLLSSYIGITKRARLGVGVGGENPKEFEASGSPHSERGSRVSEGIDVVRTLWRDSPATFKGRFTQFEGVSIDPKP